jgi:hypothetical protein
VKRGAASSLLAALLVLLLAVPVLAWTVTHRDADDFEIAPASTRPPSACTSSPRIDGGSRSGSRASWDLTTGCVCCSTPAEGRTADFVMVTTVRDLDLVACNVHVLEGPRIDANCDADPFRAWWGVARNDLDRTKVIRWRVVAMGGPGLTEVTDRAPDTGWYR